MASDIVSKGSGNSSTIVLVFLDQNDLGEEGMFFVTKISKYSHRRVLFSKKTFHFKLCLIEREMKTYKPPEDQIKNAQELSVY